MWRRQVPFRPDAVSAHGHCGLHQAGDITGETDLRASDAGGTRPLAHRNSFVIAPIILLVMVIPTT